MLIVINGSTYFAISVHDLGDDELARCARISLTEEERQVAQVEVERRERARKEARWSEER
jgi:hypothetical protein